MQVAVTAALDKQTGVNKAYKYFDVPKTTVMRHVCEAGSSQAIEVITKKTWQETSLTSRS